MKLTSFALVVLLVLGVVFFASKVYAADAKIVATEGNVQVKAAPGAELKNAEKGVVLSQGAEVITGSNSTCEIGLGEGQKSAVKIQPESKAVLASLDPVKVNLETGKLFSLVRNLKKGSDFQIHTPTAVASARGTGGVHTLNFHESYNGTFSITGANGQQKDLPEGKGINVGQDGSLGELYDVSDTTMEEWIEFEKEREAAGGDEGFGDDEGGPDADQLIESQEGGRESQDEDDIEGSREPKEEYTGYSVGY